jgi:hypothetical protein
MAKKQHQLDRERSSGYIEKALCGRDMPQENTWGFESCEACASVARARKDREDRVLTKPQVHHATRLTTTPHIDDVQGLSADARRLFDWMTAAFTGDVNEALADAKSLDRRSGELAHGVSISTWTHERLRKAHSELKERGVITPDAPDLEPNGDGAKHQHATKKSPSQLDREINEVLAPRHADRGDRVLADLASWGIDRKQLDEVRAAFRAGDQRLAMGLARDLGWNRASKRGRAFR